MCSYCNYEIVLMKVCSEFCKCLTYFVVCGFSRNIRAMNDSFLFMRFWLFESSL
jgi:hypothetical protein